MRCTLVGFWLRSSSLVSSKKLHSCMVPATSSAYQACQFSQWYHWCQGKSSSAMLPTVPLLTSPFVDSHAFRYYFSIGLRLLGFQVRRLFPDGLCLFLAQYQFLVVCQFPLPLLSSQDAYADVLTNSGGVFISLMIEAIWPQYANLKNNIPVSQGATSVDFLSFFLFW